MILKPLTEKEETTGKAIVNAAFEVHKRLNPGLLEKIYEVCFCYELKKRGINYQRQVEIPIVYDEIIFEEGLRLDVLVENMVVVERKAVDEMNPVYQA
jgi:GxxExxY protein